MTKKEDFEKLKVIFDSTFFNFIKKDFVTDILNISNIKVVFYEVNNKAIKEIISG